MELGQAKGTVATKFAKKLTQIERDINIKEQDTNAITK
jgi:hypothetical protein